MKKQRMILLEQKCLGMVCDAVIEFSNASPPTPDCKEQCLLVMYYKLHQEKVLETQTESNSFLLLMSTF